LSDDSPYRDRSQPPLVPMNNSEVVSFDVLRALNGASPARRWLVVGAVVAAFAAIGLLTFAATSTSSAGVHVPARTPTQALAYLCAQYQSAKKSYSKASATEDYSTGSATRATFERKLKALLQSAIAVRSRSLSRFESDVTDLASFLSTYAAVGGQGAADLGRVCARSAPR
jgi:hypothetical protein